MYSGGTVRKVSRQDVKLVRSEDSYEGTSGHRPHNHLQSKNTQEQPWSDDVVCTDPGESLENTRDSSFESKPKKQKTCVSSSDPCFSSLKTTGYSNPQNQIDVSKNAHIDVTHDSTKTKLVIPIGPGFQAELPTYFAGTKKGKFYGSPGDSQTLKWLGSGVWPTYSLKKKVHYKNIGEGRSESCSCVSTGSSQCIQQHSKEAHELLEKELGRSFYTWKFDEMGEVVSKSWTWIEEQKFENFVKRHPLSTSKGFWELVSKKFLGKSKKDLLSYYYNVFLNKRMRLLTSSSDNHIASDDDHYNDFIPR